jgi:hypothetical protein
VAWWALRHLGVWVVGAALLRAVVVPAEVCPPVTSADAQRAVGEAVAWLERGQNADGTFLYGYDRRRDEISRDYNTTRHTGVLLALYAVGRTGAADRGLRFVQRSLVRRDGWIAYASEGEDASVGANGLLLAALVQRREALTPALVRHRYDSLIRGIARFLVSQQRSDGSILKLWRAETGRPYPGLYGRWATGEAFWALALAHRLFSDDGFGAAAHRTVAYLATRRDEALEYATRLPDHWAAYGLAELSRTTGLDEVEVAYARRLAGYFGTMTRVESQLEGGRLVRELYGGTSSGAGLGTIGEATAALRRLAAADARLADLPDDLDSRIACVAGLLAERQAKTRRPEERGAWFQDDYTQMDDQQHAISALLGALPSLRDGT